MSLNTHIDDVPSEIPVMVGTAMTDVKSIPGTTVAEKLVISAGDDIIPFPTVSSKTIVKFGTPASFGVPLSCTLYQA